MKLRWLFADGELSGEYGPEYIHARHSGTGVDARHSDSGVRVCIRAAQAAEPQLLQACMLRKEWCEHLAMLQVATDLRTMRPPDDHYLFKPSNQRKRPELSCCPINLQRYKAVLHYRPTEPIEGSGGESSAAPGEGDYSAAIGDTTQDSTALLVECITVGAPAAHPLGFPDREDNSEGT